MKRIGEILEDVLQRRTKRMKSTGTKIERLSALRGTKDLSAWESDFVENIVRITTAGTRVGFLSEAQLEVIERLYSKHFGD